MPRYEVKFFIDCKKELSPAEETNLAHDVHARMDQRGWIPKPVDRKIYVRREYQEHEKVELIHRHAKVDWDAGRDWNVRGQGCSCEVCREYRDGGATVSGRADGIDAVIPLPSQRRKRSLV